MEIIKYQTLILLFMMGEHPLESIDKDHFYTTVGGHEFLYNLVLILSLVRWTQIVVENCLYIYNLFDIIFPTLGGHEYSYNGGQNLSGVKFILIVVEYCSITLRTTLFLVGGCEYPYNLVQLWVKWSLIEAENGLLTLSTTLPTVGGCGYLYNLGLILSLVKWTLIVAKKLFA